MKVNRILFILSGVIRSVVAGFSALITLLMLGLRGVIKEMLATTYEIVDNLVKELSSTDASYAYLLENTNEQNVEFVLSIVDKFCVIVLIWIAVMVALAVFNFLYARKCKIERPLVDWKSITMVVVSWLCPFSWVSATLTTIGVFYKKKRKNTTGDIVIEVEEK